MSKLIGTNPNQVPSNADLGTAAFMDKKDFLLSKGSSLSAIDAVIPNTATDVFIYDTSKDSDGGAWRKRTQHTSWYNEHLNTTARGSRREFPAVAVIVAESGQATIYDGDDPSLPMWMIFEGGINSGSNNLLLNGSGESMTSIAMLNGVLTAGKSSGSAGLATVNFISEYSISIQRNSANYAYIYKGTISERNDRKDYTATADTADRIQGDKILDLDMAVMPNASTDPATGLPIPTIVVGTDVGTSVIKDNGTIVSRAYTWRNNGGVHTVEFDGEGYWYGTGYYTQYEGTYPNHGGIYSFSDLNSTSILNASNSRSDSNLIIGTGTTNGTNSYWGVDVDIWMPNAVDANMGLSDTVGGKYYSGRNGITVVEADGNLHSHITSDYNTGYMVGQDGSTKLATLADTNTSDATDREFVTNGTFDTDASGWQFSGLSPSVNSGELEVDVNAAGHYMSQVVTDLEPGEKYIYTWKARRGTMSSISMSIYCNTTGSNIVAPYSYGATTTMAEYSLTFTVPVNCTSVNIYVIRDSGTTGTAYFDDFSLKKAEKDRSVHDNGLQVFGTVKKTPVASGADLVAYSGFSGSNFLQQPYSTTTQLGTGDFSLICWSKTSVTDGSNQFIFDTRDASNTAGIAIWIIGTTGEIRLLTKENSTNSLLDGDISVTGGEWHHISCVRRNGTLEIYIDGKLDSSASGLTVRDLNTVNSKTHIGINQSQDTSLSHDGSMAILRFSATAPSAEQIKKIYEDEKVLFQENAKATLYGTSDAVTALAYDEDTNLLHAGTSAGRSVFQGLRRVDNTTRAVGTAISAIDGFVVEE